MSFAQRGSAALNGAHASLNAGFDAIVAAYKQGWVDYRNQLRPMPAAALPVAGEYETSLLVLKAHEDKDNPGAFVASPSMPWGWGELRIDPDNPRSAPYHLVWARDLYQIATALLAAGDAPAANRALDFLFDRQQLDDGSFPQNSQVDGKPKWKSLQMDQVGLPIVLAWQLNRFAPKDWRHVRKAADVIVEKGPISEQERWENQEGYSPATIAAEIAGLVCAADIATRNGDGKRAAKYLAKADSWAANVERWTATTNGPYSDAPYYLRVTKDRKPDKAHRVRDRRLRAFGGRPAPRGRRQLPRARPPGRQACRRSDGPEHARGRRQPAQGRRILAPLQLRRLRRAPRREVVAHLPGRHAQDARPGLADLRR